MIYKDFKDIKLSTLGMGNMRLPVMEDVEGRPIDYDKAEEIIDYAMSKGVNYYDTAYVYHNGESETFLGKAMKKYARDSFYFATKFNLMANPDYEAVFEEQLSRLQTDYIDFYLIHAVVDDNCDGYINCGCIEYFKEQKRNGRIKYLGFSSHASVDTLKRFADCSDWDFAQIQLNYYDWYYGNAKKEYEALVERNLPIIVMEPVRGGRLATLSSDASRILADYNSNWNNPAWALRWVKSLPQVQVVLSGMSTLDQIKENIVTFEDNLVLDEKCQEVIAKACDAFNKQMKVPCTACRYCTDDCPMKIDIPNFLEVYNRYKIDGPWALGAMKDVKSKGTPKDCIGCGACMRHCPQGINIPKLIQELANV